MTHGPRLRARQIGIGEPGAAAGAAGRELACYR